MSNNVTQELATTDQDCMNEEGDGWAEDCSGAITITHPEGSKVQMDGVVTLEDIKKDLKDDPDWSSYKHMQSKLGL